MSKGISNPPRSACCWPGCERQSADFPLCWNHSVRAYSMVQRTTAALIEHRTVKVEDRPGFVYFLRFRDMVKIGYSDNPQSRTRAHPSDEVYGWLPGTLRDEKRCHAAFDHLRTTGEWFRAEADLMEFISGLELQQAG